MARTQSKLRLGQLSGKSRLPLFWIKQQVALPDFPGHVQIPLPIIVLFFKFDLVNLQYEPQTPFVYLSSVRRFACAGTNDVVSSGR